MKRLTTEEFTKRASKVHNFNYTYAQTKYKNTSTKVTITCPKHGDFEQIPNGHLQGKGCSKCAGKCKKLTTADFIKESIKVQGNKYAYGKSIYIDSKTKITITCPAHGDFEQLPAHHKKGHGCRLCAKLKSKEQFIKDCLTVHGNTYDYSQTKYYKDREEVVITCRKHGNFNQIASGHLQGNGCPQCACAGFDKTKPGYLYYLKVVTENNGTLYKIGITNRTVNERFSLQELTKIEIIKQKLYSVGFEAYDWEQKLIKKYKEFQYKGPDILSSGNTELFTEDIIAMWHTETKN